MTARPLEAAGNARTSRLVIGLCCVAYMLDGMDVIVMSYVAPALARDWAVSAQMLGLLFGTGFAGMMAGGLAVAPLGDIVGRRIMVIGALAVMGIGMVASGLAPDLGVMIAIRLIVGVALGTLVATASALAAESVPDRDRLSAVAIVQSGYPLGSILLGIAAIWTIPSIGWRGTLMMPGVLTLAFVPVALALLPESRAFGIRRTESPKALVAALLGAGRAAATVRLWLASFACSLSLFFVLSWIPKLAIDLGLSPTAATLVGMTYNLGAWLGTLGMAVGVRRVAPSRMVGVMLTAAAVLFLAITTSAVTLPSMLVVVLLTGFCIQGGYNGIPGLASSIYPVEARSTGIGWAIGVGRAGAILGPLIGGVLLGSGLRLDWLFIVFAVPLALAATLLRSLALRERDPALAPHIFPPRVIEEGRS